MAACDLIICRAGAMTLSEILVFDKPAILIPSPNVVENHQFYNAVSFAKNHKASVIQENRLNMQILMKEIDRLIKNKHSNKKSLDDLNFSIGACKRVYRVLKCALKTG
jgi:UDP-N-acetylglucosamine--N-acetylmuramyl-(pentapeptide) pyrophosphoryl-undecaprenol N-acetylglucosamine transferase